MINKQKIINTNRIFGEREYMGSNLDFEVDSANMQKDIFKQLAHITRAMTNGHSFSDANKRTALVVIKSELADRGIKCDQRRLARDLVELSNTRERDIPVIERRLRNTCKTKLTK